MPLMNLYSFDCYCEFDHPLGNVLEDLERVPTNAFKVASCIEHYKKVFVAY